MNLLEHVTPGRLSAFLVCSYAFIRGGAVEKCGAAAIAIGWIATILVDSIKGPPNFAYVTVDVITLGAFLALAVLSHKVWPIFLAGFQLVSTATHFASAILHLDVVYEDWWSYAAVLNVCSGWGLLLVLGIGVWLHQRNIKRRQVMTKAVVQD